MYSLKAANNLTLNSKYIALLLMTISLFISACTQKQTPELLKHLSKDSQQVLVVSSESWRASTGTLQRYDKEGNHWNAVGDSIPVVLGRNGTSWGRGLHSEENLGHFKQGR